MALSSTRPPEVGVGTHSPESSNTLLNSSIGIGLQPSFHLTPSSQSLFQNARNVEVKDSQINAISNANVAINSNTTNNDPVTTILWPHVVAGAIFNSAARYAAGKCYPGTRKMIIDKIVDWIQDPDPNTSVLWVYGAAGAGKSAVAHTICELLKESHPDNDGGSFFFASGTPDRGNALMVFTTLAYQLAVQFPLIRTELNNILFRDPSLPTKSMEIQLRSLVVEPLLRCNPQLSHSPVLIIDGLDECDNDMGTTQADIVALISKSVVGHDIPLRFMIFSRPEYWIRDAFDTAPLPDITLSLSFRDDIDTDDDIRAYLTEEFERIRRENKRFMKSVVPPWPPKKIIDRFVADASGQYVYAATVLRFVGNISKFSDPQKHLEIVMSPGPHRALAFSELDRLYATILSAYPEWETMKRVLAALLLGANSTIITVILGVRRDDLDLVLDALSSLIEIQESPIFGTLIITITFSHRSFDEFLQDKARSGAFYIDLDSDPVASEVVNATFDMIHRSLDQNYEKEAHIFLNIDRLTYDNEMWTATNTSLAHCTASMVLPLITRLIAELELFDPGRLTHMHSVFYFIRGIDFFVDMLYDVDGPSKFEIQLRTGQEKPEMSTEFRTACQKLRQAVNQAREGALAALPSCTDFEPTPILVYLTEYHFNHFDLPLDGLRTIAGVTNIMDAVEQYCYILPLRYIPGKGRELRLIDPPFGSDTSQKTGLVWRTEGTWKDLRISLTPKALRSILLIDPITQNESSTRQLALARFFNTMKISDIRNKEYFQNTSNLALLAAMTDLPAWTGLLDVDRNLNIQQKFLVSILCWINRQLTNSQTMILLEDYDNTIQQIMVSVMKFVFQHGFLQGFIPYQNRDGLSAFRSGYRGETKNAKSTAIKVWPLPKGLYEEEMNLYAARNNWCPDEWQPFHDELFERTVGNINTSIEPIIHPSQWHPYLAIALLKVLVRFLYGRIHPEFSTEENNYEESFPYLPQCLPYAHPTAENLDALRAIVYLYPQVTPTWNPPEGLWSSLVEFLQKYDHSLLSSEELRLFVVWLNSTNHADIETYIGPSMDTGVENMPLTAHPKPDGRKER